MPISRDPTKGRFTDVGIASKWNKKLTVAKNFALLGVTANVNTEAKVAASRTARLNKADIESLLTMMDEGAPALASGSIVERNPTRAAHFIKADEIEYLRVSGLTAASWRARCAWGVAYKAASWRARCDHHVSLLSLPLQQNLSQKHGHNFIAMQRDTKANPMQHTAEHLETRFARLEKFEAAAEAEAAGGDGGMDVEEAAAGSAAKGATKKKSKKVAADTAEIGADFMDFATKNIKPRK